MNIQCASKVVLKKSKPIAQLTHDNAKSTVYIIIITDMLNNTCIYLAIITKQTAVQTCTWKYINEVTKKLIYLYF